MFVTQFVIFRSLAVNNRPFIRKDEQESPKENIQSNSINYSTTKTTLEEIGETVQPITPVYSTFEKDKRFLSSEQTLKESEEFFRPSFAKRVSLTPRSESSSKSSLDNDESGRSPQKDVVQYTVSIKLQGNSANKKEVSPAEVKSRFVDIGNSAPKKEVSPTELRSRFDDIGNSETKNEFSPLEQQKSRFVDITLTDYSSNETDFIEENVEESSIPIPVFHFPERKTEENISPPMKRPNFIPIVSQLEPDETTWRKIPIAKVDKSPSFEIPTFCFPQQKPFSPDVAAEEGQTLEIEEMNLSQGSSPHSLRQGFESHVDNDVTAKVEVTKCKSFVEFEELSDESSEEDVEADEDVERIESESESESDPDQDHEELDSEHSSRSNHDLSGSDHDEVDFEEKREKEKSFEPEEEEEEEDDEDESFATCSSDLSSNKNERQLNSCSRRSTSGHRSRHSRTRSPPPQQQQQQQQQDEVEEQNVFENNKVDVWESNDLKTEVEVSDIEEEEEELSNIPDIEALAENREVEMFKLMQNGESPSIVSRYLSRIEREISETESEDESFEAFRTMRMRTGTKKSSLKLIQ